MLDPDILLYKLISGETIISKNIYEQTLIDNEYIVFNKPLILILHHTQEGPQFGFAPWMDDNCEVKHSSIIARSNVPSVIKNEYIKMTTNIQLMN